MKGTFMALSANGTPEIVTGKVGLSEIYEYTNGGPIEMVEVPMLDGVTPAGLAFWCNEEGKLRTLPVNDLVTNICQGPTFNDFVVGDVLFFRSRGDNGRLLPDGAGLSQSQLAWLKAMVS